MTLLIRLDHTTAAGGRRLVWTCTAAGCDHHGDVTGYPPEIAAQVYQLVQDTHRHPTKEHP